MKREWFVFYQSFLRAWENLPDKEQLLYYQRVLKYWVDWEDIESWNWVVEAMFQLVKPQLDANNKKYQNGTKGGRPKNQTITKTKPNNNQTITKVEPKDKDNVKDKDKDKEKNKNYIKEEEMELKKEMENFIKEKPWRRKLYDKDLLNKFYIYRTQPFIKWKYKWHIKKFEQNTRSLQARLDRFLDWTLKKWETVRWLKKQFWLL